MTDSLQAHADPAHGNIATGTQSDPADEWSYWRAALAAKRGVETERGNPRPGYYRVKGEAWAFWFDSGEVNCWRSNTAYHAPTKADAIDEAFGWCAPHPVSFENFTHFQRHGRWPDEIAPVEIAANLQPHERAEAELTAQRAAMAEWIAEIKAVQTQEQATKAGNFADLFAKIEKASDDARKAEKEPFLEGGRVIDAKWQPVVKRAADLKVWAKKSTEPFLIAEKARIAAEETRRHEAAVKAAREAEERRQQAEASGAPPPVDDPIPLPAPPPVKAKAGKVHLRTVTKYQITDMRAVLEYFAKLNDQPAELKDVLQLLVNRMRHAGVEIPGVETKTAEVAS